jgi:hypothetical protein
MGSVSSVSLSVELVSAWASDGRCGNSVSARQMSKLRFIALLPDLIESSAVEVVFAALYSSGF